MLSFVDETRITVSSGCGGPGSVSFRREKYVPNGGPDGGDGGRGGDVVFQIRSNLKTLVHLHRKHEIKASTGGGGKGARRHGADGEPAFVLVPPGTILKDAETGEAIRDFSVEEDGTDWTFLKGGRGGQGNWHFRTARQQAPRFAQPGMPGETRELILELNLIADVGLVGFPNAGKSSLLKAMTNANPKIAPYPFTTKIPNLGVFRIMDRDIVIADIPGLIEGASHGAGLGFQFLKHIARTKCLAFLLDLSEDDPLGAYRTLCSELAAYAPELAEKKHLLIGTKTDLEGTDERLAELKSALPDEEITGMSSYNGDGMEELRKAFIRLTEK